MDARRIYNFDSLLRAELFYFEKSKTLSKMAR